MCLSNVWEALRGGQRAVHNGQRLQGVALCIDGRLQAHQLVQDAQRYLCSLHTVDGACKAVGVMMWE